MLFRSDHSSPTQELSCPIRVPIPPEDILGCLYGFQADEELHSMHDILCKSNDAFQTLQITLSFWLDGLVSTLLHFNSIHKQLLPLIWRSIHAQLTACREELSDLIQEFNSSSPEFKGANQIVLWGMGEFMRSIEILYTCQHRLQWLMNMDPKLAFLEIMGSLAYTASQASIIHSESSPEIPRLCCRYLLQHAR